MQHTVKQYEGWRNVRRAKVNWSLNIFPSSESFSIIKKKCTTHVNILVFGFNLNFFIFVSLEAYLTFLRILTDILTIKDWYISLAAKILYSSSSTHVFLKYFCKILILNSNIMILRQLKFCVAAVSAFNFLFKSIIISPILFVKIPAKYRQFKGLSWWLGVDPSANAGDTV